MTAARVLLGVSEDPMSYQQHVRVHGELRPNPSRDPALSGEFTRAALRGRGGGGFPLGSKLDAVQRARGDAIVVVNACESEPMSVKDRLLTQSLPHLVLDGALACARALGAGEILIAVEQTSVQVSAAIDFAIGERRDLGRGGMPAELVEVPPGYVSGQETAIVSFLNGGPAKPMAVPPRVSERGVDRRPTLISNAETLAHAALIARHGAKWFRQLGTPDEPGSVLVTLGGGVGYPAVYEIEHGSSLRSLLAAAEGVPEPIRAFLFGGYAGAWVDAAAATNLRLSRAGLQRFGASLGAGVIVALPQSACPVAEVTRVAAWMAEQSAVQCGPCSNGLPAISDALGDLAAGQGHRDAVHDIRRWAAMVRGRGACAHPDGTARFVTSALTVFTEEFDDHALHGPCDACLRPPTLPTSGLQTVTR
jgi:NADH:ubiquinone oxidoreductase subunit F (NADH-binding)